MLYIDNVTQWNKTIREIFVTAVEHGSWGGSGSCAQRLCECDRSL